MTGDNMNKVNRIRIYFLFATTLLLGTFQMITIQDANSKEVIPEVAAVTEKSADTGHKDTNEYVSALKKESYKYIILEEEDYLTVYFSDRETVYEYSVLESSGCNPPENPQWILYQR